MQLSGIRLLFFPLPMVAALCFAQNTSAFCASGQHPEMATTVAPIKYARTETASRVCTVSEAMRAESLPNAPDWRSLYAQFTAYGHCDDGAIAEGFSMTIENLLAHRWPTVRELDLLARRHPRFKRFVLKHIDATWTFDYASTIHKNSSSHCPRGASQLCREIDAMVMQAKSADSDLTRD